MSIHLGGIMQLFLALGSALALAGLAVPAAASAERRGTQAQRADNSRRSADLLARMGQVDARIGEAERSRAIGRPRATDLRRQIARTRQDVTSLSRKQGFVSAAELASYNRTLGTIDVELDNRGVPRRIDRDMPNYAGRDYRNDRPNRGTEKDVTNH
jgi:hypothetical protein